MTAPRAAAACLGLLALATSGCTKRTPRPAANPSVVALVGGQPVMWKDVAAYLKGAAGDEPKDVTPRVASSLFDQYLEELLLERAEEDAVPPLAGRTPAERRRALISRRADLEGITEEDLRREYAEHPDRFWKPALIRASQLMFRSRPAAEAALKRLSAGEAWGDVSRTASVAPNAASGGSLGLLARTDLPRDFEKVLWGLPAGKTTGIIAAPHGFHIFRVDERFDAKDIPFEEARPALRLVLAQERSTKAAADLVAESLRRHPVAIMEEHLPFTYVGVYPRWVPARR
ncbi:MAG: peptidylprolyl isomerase [Acidithiobacillales bacterium]